MDEFLNAHHPKNVKKMKPAKRTISCTMKTCPDIATGASESNLIARRVLEHRSWVMGECDADAIAEWYANGIRRIVNLA